MPRICSRCGYPLSIYNKGSECFCHSRTAQIMPKIKIENHVIIPDDVIDGALKHEQDDPNTKSGFIPEDVLVAIYYER